MSQFPDAEPFLQIIHISDLHLVDPAFPHRREVRLVERCARFYPPFRDKWLDGTAPHDPLAPGEFGDFLQRITVDDPEWKHRATWIVDTGDLTTFGDDPSLMLGESYLAQWATLARAALFSLHGNHDAWPERFPLLGRGGVAAHRAKLRSRYYTERWAEQPLACPIPGTRGHVLLFGLNSVLHEPWRNTFAVGEIKEDCYWENASKPRDGVQLDRLARHVGQEKSFRIVCSHHPVHYPARPMFGMHMANDKSVGLRLSGTAPSGNAPLAHLVLSGHTHKLFPDHGDLRKLVRDHDHPYLGVDQMQLIVGSLLQHDVLGDRGQWSQQFQVLRLYAPVKHQNVIIIERFLAARWSETGSFGFVRTADGDECQEIVAAY